MINKKTAKNIANRVVRLSAALTAAFVVCAQPANALEMPKSINDLVLNSGLSARSYLVMDKATDNILISKDENVLWTPASMTKLVTALVVLDTKPNMNKVVAMAKSDEVGGARLATKAGIKYKVGDLFYASLVASANNATNALARSTGLSKAQFVSRMNSKAKSLGATHTAFVEPTGISEKNMTTASDYAKIAKAAFANAQIRKMAMTPSYKFTAYNNRKYSHNLKNTNKLLSDADLTMLGGKTGYLEESMYNFVTEVKDRYDNDMIVVLLGSKNSGTQFSETKQLALWGSLAKSFRATFADQAEGGGAASGSIN